MARTKQTAQKSSGGRPPNKRQLVNMQQQQRKRLLPGHGGVKKGKRRFRAGTVALREIRKYQKTWQLLLRKLPFQKVVREICQDFATDLRWRKEAVQCLQVTTITSDVHACPTCVCHATCSCPSR